MLVHQDGKHPPGAKRSRRLVAPDYRINPMKGRHGGDEVKGTGNHLKPFKWFFTNLHIGHVREVPRGEPRQFAIWLEAHDFTR
jgi:hypothetical protein